MKTSYLYITTAVFEALTGLALLIQPSKTTELLLGLPLTEISGIIVARVAAAALIALALACWLARTDAQSGAAKGLIAAMLLYNITALTILIYTALVLGFTVMLLLALIIHFALTAWCIYALQNAKQNKI